MFFSVFCYCEEHFQRDFPFNYRPPRTKIKGGPTFEGVNIYDKTGGVEPAATNSTATPITVSAPARASQAESAKVSKMVASSATSSAVALSLKFPYPYYSERILVCKI